MRFILALAVLILVSGAAHAQKFLYAAASGVAVSEVYGDNCPDADKDLIGRFDAYYRDFYAFQNKRERIGASTREGLADTMTQLRQDWGKGFARLKQISNKKRRERAISEACRRVRKTLLERFIPTLERYRRMVIDGKPR